MTRQAFSYQNDELQAGAKKHLPVKKKRVKVMKISDELFQDRCHAYARNLKSTRSGAISQKDKDLKEDLPGMICLDQDMESWKTKPKKQRNDQGGQDAQKNEVSAPENEIL